MTLDPDVEHEQMRAKYPALGVRDAILWLALLAGLGVISLFRDVNWWLLVGMACAAVGWEFTKARLRRNAREFAEASRRAV